MLLGKPYHNNDLLLKRGTSSNINLTERGAVRRRHVSHSLCIALNGCSNVVLSPVLLLTGLNGHHRLLYPAETNASSSKLYKKKIEEERIFENLIWIWTLELMWDKNKVS